MAWAFVQAPASVTNITTPTLTLAFASNVTSGNRVLAVAGGHSISNHALPNDPTISHTGTATVDSWTSILGPITTNDPALGKVRIWTAEVTATGSMTVVATKSTSASTYGLGLAIAEYSGLSTAVGTAALDVSASKTVTVGAGTGTDAYTSGLTAATSAANELVFGVWMDDGYGARTLTAGTGFTKRAGGTGGEIPLQIEDKDSGSVGATPAATFTTSSGTEKNAVLCVVMNLPAVALPQTRTRLLVPVGRAALR